MKNLIYITIAMLMMVTSPMCAEKIPFSERASFPTLPLEYRQKHCKHVEREIAKRWAKVKKSKPTFTKYSAKDDAEIVQEFNNLNKFREKIWVRDPNDSPVISHEDYLMAQEIIAQGAYRGIHVIAFDYNLTDKSYNASTILTRTMFKENI